MLEREFLDMIDCNFPYNDIEKAKDIINLARNISLNAIFGVIHELSRIPKSKQVNVKKEDLDILLGYIREESSNSLITEVIELVHKNIMKDIIPRDIILNMMERIRVFPGLYEGLSIVYFLSNNEDELIERKYEEIINSWNN